MHSQGKATVRARTIERHRDWNQPRSPSRKRGAIVVVDGFGVRVRVERGRLVVEDGAGRNRQTRQFSRASSRLERLVVLDGSGSLSLEALRWLQDVGTGLLCIDRDGRLLCTSSPTRSEAKLRRAQALAPFDASALQVARFLLSRKLDGQQGLLQEWLPANTYANRVLARCLATMQAAETVEELVAAEAEAAAAYWACWRHLAVRFRPQDQRRRPEAWQTFGRRQSPLSGSPRLAVTPAGAILNYLYALLEAEARLACLQLGLDPALAVIHADVRGRDSLPLDLMEAVRPSVDRYLLALLRDGVFAAADFHETRRGNVRILPPLTRQLAETLPAWRQLIAPVAEQVAHLLLQTTPHTVQQPPTPLTVANRRADRARRHQRPAAPAQTRVPKPERRCKRCGGPVPHRERVYCDDCLPHYQADRYQAFVSARDTARRNLQEGGVDRSHGGEAAAKRGASVSRHQHEARRWNETHERPEPSLFEQEILPSIRDLPLADLVRATGLTHGYLSQVRRGMKTPHPRHWPALRHASTANHLTREVRLLPGGFLQQGAKRHRPAGVPGRRVTSHD
jgi:CRISPR-associated endonuclease Cas1